MAPRKRTLPPVEIVLTEEDLAAVIRETRAAPGPSFVPPEPLEAPPLPPLPAVPEHPRSLGEVGPGAVGDAIRMILEATTIERGRRLRFPGGLS